MIIDMKNAFEEDKRKRKALHSKELEEWKKQVEIERKLREKEFKKEKEAWEEERKKGKKK